MKRLITSEFLEYREEIFFGNDMTMSDVYTDDECTNDR